ncbi:cytochrome P450 [Obba rivulosa]|uniref:Cytochrome P450 n=1 Tax=Obba rivulosa TaxID=1052685 RepID=A0A8E2DDJ0_9APHY|nr:cytochrome P450 [Obba rivulosa]
MSLVVYLSLFLIPFVLYASVSRLYGTSRLPLPPGPPAKPFIGNILSVLPKKRWSELIRHRQFDWFIPGNLAFFHGFGKNMLVVNSIDDVREMLEKRADIYAARPWFTVACEVFGAGEIFPMRPSGDPEWRLQRKLVHFGLSQTAVKRYTPAQEDIAALLAKQLLETPSAFFDHVRLATSRLILAVTYGFSAETAATQGYIQEAEYVIKTMSESVEPGAYLCDAIPILRHVPAWIPLFSKMNLNRGMFTKFFTRPYEHVKHQLMDGTARPSFVQHLLYENAEAREVASFEYSLKCAAGSMYGGGVETVGMTILTCMMAMALNPDKQRLAQEEINRVIGGDRLPRLDDRPNLPYIAAVIKETMRWQPALPLGFARATTKDDEYNGYHIPSGTYILPNVWFVSMVDKYNVDEFIPERFLDSEESVHDPWSYALGFGRRYCPGRYLTEDTLFIDIVTILAMFNLEPEGEVKPEFTVTTIGYPKPYKCHIVPRSEAKVQLILARAMEATF